MCGSILEEATTALEKAEAREVEEVRVRLMETNRYELIELAGKVEGQAEEAELGLLIELCEEIECRRDNVASMSRMLKGNIREEFGERAQRAFDESVEAARVAARWGQGGRTWRLPPRQQYGAARRGPPFQVRASWRGSGQQRPGGIS